MEIAISQPGFPQSAEIDRACDAAGALLDAARDSVHAKVAPGGVLDRERLDVEQYAAHALAWLAVHVEALRQMRRWARRLDEAGRFARRERLILNAAFAEYGARIRGGMPMSQGEIARPADLGLGADRVAALMDSAFGGLIAEGWTADARQRLAHLIEDGDFGKWGLAGDDLVMMRDEMGRFAGSALVPNAQSWHRDDVLIPDDVVAQIADLGVFGLDVPEEYGGLGMGKEAVCVVTEELSRGYLGVGSLGTRSEIAAELIRTGGTAEQKQRYLPRIASGDILPTAVFTEPDTGSDMASLTTRAVLNGENYQVTGAKTWITHAARANLMTILCRTNPDEKGYRGLSMLLAEKPRGNDADPFPVAGLSGSEISVLGYRGMKEYTLAFDEFVVPADGLLGGVEGQGFKQLMATFEAARIQTAARALGVARNALELGLAYANERVQFKKPLFAFPRVHGKLAWMAVEIMIARQLTLHAARERDAGRRCDLEAGLAKLLAAQVAWSCADNALQIHGGNGYATEFAISRVLCDARILNIFEGAAEIQAQVVARRLLGF